VTIGKALTTYSRVSEGLLAAVDVAAKQLGMSGREMLGHTSLLIYGTTIATNAVATRRIAKTALLVTQGAAKCCPSVKAAAPAFAKL